jgi:hypothetical protein
VRSLGCARLQTNESSPMTRVTGPRSFVEYPGSQGYHIGRQSKSRDALQVKWNEELPIIIILSKDNN